MSFRRTLFSIAAPAAMLLTAGCVEPSFKANVSRFQALPAPAGQTFYVVSSDPRLRGGLEFSQYAGMVATRLAQQGYRPAASPSDANLLVTLDYGVDNGHEKIVSEPGFGPGFGYGGWGGYGAFGGYGGFGGGWGGGRFGGRYGGWYGGWGDPFWYQGFGAPRVDSYTYFVSHLEMKIRNKDGQVLFEGRAKARSLDDKLQHLVPNLVEAMFTGFPGRSGEDVLITVPPPPKPGSAPINRGS
jgi:hypothetical protein